MKIAQALLLTSVLAGVATPSLAASISGVTQTGDNYIYCADATSTFRGSTCTDSLSTVLGGDASSPTGNVELGARTETVGFASQGSLTGNLNGTSITLSSMTAADWDAWSGASAWWDTFKTQAFKTNLAGSMLRSINFTTAKSNGLLAIFSDPNISYVNQNETTGAVSIGLAGHFNASSRLKTAVGAAFASGVNDLVQASEVVKVIYGNDSPRYLASFTATASGLKNDKGVGADQTSHNGNYEVSFQGRLPEPPSTAVPEPASVLGVMTIGGLFSALKRKSA